MSDYPITSAWLPAELKERLVEAAWQQRVSRSELIRLALQKLLNEIDSQSRDCQVTPTTQIKK